MSVSIHTHTYTCTHMLTCVLMSEDILQKSELSLYHVGPGNQTQVSRVELYQLSYHVDPEDEVSNT